MRTFHFIELPAMTTETFGKFRDLIYKETGIFMRESKRILVSNRLRKRIIALGLKSYDEYYNLLTDMDRGKKELPNFVDAVSTNETYFYRGDNQFEALKQVILPEIYKRQNKLRVWSAGCSTGEEPYTISMIAMETAEKVWKGNIEIVGTDINTEVIEKAIKGRYQGRTLKYLPKTLIERYFYQTGEGMYFVKDIVKNTVKFKVHNLLKDKPPGLYFDIIFCRNVMIYFDIDTQKALVDGVFRRVISPNGYLLIGHSESLTGKSKYFQYAHILKAPIYQLRTDMISKKKKIGWP